MIKKYKKKAFAFMLLIFSLISIISLNFNIEMPVPDSAGFVYEWTTTIK